jgi:hypothetical protein
MRKAQRIPRNRDVDLDELELFYENLEIASRDVDPANIYNMDESGFSCSRSEFKIITKKGIKNSFFFTADGEKKQFTLAIRGDANAEFCLCFLYTRQNTSTTNGVEIDSKEVFIQLAPQVGWNHRP